jgi:trafficking protein particle complex subunit 11
MANLIEKVNFPELESSSASLFRLPEKNLSAERLQPWELLHHSGYWYRAAARHLLDRRKLAQLIAEEDRIPPNQPTQGAIPRKAYNYDTYMCPEPFEENPSEGAGVNHAQLIFDRLTLARAEFHNRRQKRITMELTLDSCKELENMGKWEQLLELLVPLWRDMSFRSEGWDIVEAVGWTLRNAAFKAGRKELIVAIDWELMNRGLYSLKTDSNHSLTTSQSFQGVLVGIMIF